MSESRLALGQDGVFPGSLQRRYLNNYDEQGSSLFVRRQVMNQRSGEIQSTFLSGTRTVRSDTDGKLLHSGILRKARIESE